MSFAERAREKAVRLLRWSEHYTKTDMVYLASGGFWLSAGYAASSLSSFALALVFANILDPNTYGAYRYVLAVASVLSVAVLPGIDVSLQRSVARGKEGAMFAVTWTRVRWGSIANIFAAGLALYYLLHHNTQLAAAFLAVACCISIMDPLACYDDLLRGRRAFRTATNLAVIGQLASTFIMMGVAVLFPSLFPIVIAYFAGWCVIRGALLIYTLRTFPPNDVQDPEAVPYGKHLTVMKGASVIAASLGSIFLFHISAVQLAVYSIAVAPIEQMRGMLNNVESLVLPKFSQDSWDVWNWRTLVRKSGPLFAVLGVGIVVYVLAAPYLYAILFHKYIAAIPYTQVWAFSLLLTALSVLLGAILRARKEVKKLYIFNVASITSTFLFIGPLTYFYGIWGLLGAQYAVKTVETITFCYLTSWNPRFAEKSAQSSDGENGTNANA